MNAQALSQKFPQRLPVVLIRPRVQVPEILERSVIERILSSYYRECHRRVVRRPHDRCPILADAALADELRDACMAMALKLGSWDKPNRASKSRN
jgi:hypothetical protein